MGNACKDLFVVDGRQVTAQRYTAQVMYEELSAPFYDLFLVQNSARQYPVMCVAENLHGLYDHICMGIRRLDIV